MRHLRSLVLGALITGAPAVLLTLPGTTLHAQDAGQISGVVVDTTGAVVPNAQVSLRNTETNSTRTATANGQGEYQFTGLAPAHYEVTTAATAGFGATRSAVEVLVGGKETVDIKLGGASNNTTIEVTADSGIQVNSQSQELSQVVSEAQVSQLPSLTRNPYDFVALSGNVSSGDRTASGGDQNVANRGVGFTINGQRSTGTEILLDGVENIGVFNDDVGIKVPLDAVHEFRVITTNYEPQYGRASGGIVSVATKAGSNRFRGNLWEFNRIAAVTANTVTNAQSGQAKGQYTRNQFGFDVGGPIFKDKLFFQGSTEWTRVRSAATQLASIPTPQFLGLASPNIQSFFSAYGTGAPTNYRTTTTAAQIEAATEQSDANGNPIAGSGTIIPNIPASTPVFGTVGFTAPGDAGGGLPQNTYNIVGRFDYNFSNNTQVFFRYVDYDEIDQIGSNFASPYAQYNVGTATANQAYLLNLTHEFNAALTSITKASFSRFNQSYTYDTALQNVPTLFISADARNPVDNSAINLPGFYNSNPANGGLPFGGPQNTVQINQDVAIVKGRHGMQFGGQILYIQDNQAYGAYAQAGAQLGNGRGPGLQNLQTGNVFQFLAAVDPRGALPCVADTYTGTLSVTPSCSVNLPASAPSFARSDRFHDWAVYGQDAWKVSPKLTVNYGARYEYYGVQHNDNQALDSNFFYGAGTSLPQEIRNGVVQTGISNSIGHGLWKPQYGTVSPRVGFAYDLSGDGKMSIRGGYGISYERNFGNVTFNVIQNPPNYAVIVVNNTPLTNSNAGPLGGANGSVPLPPTSLRNVDENIRTAQTQFWDAAIERQLGNGNVVSVQYAAARGVHLYDIKNYNGIGSGNATLGDPNVDPLGRIDPRTNLPYTTLTRLNPQYSNINNRGSNGDSYYEALNIQFQSSNYRKSGLSLVANYTLSHALDDLSTTFSESNSAFSLGYTNPFNPGFDHGNSDLDIRHRLVIAPIYQTPRFRSGHALLSQALGGWQISGIYTVRTGTPFTYFDTTNNVSGYNVARYTPAAGQTITQRSFTKIPKGQNGGGANSYTLGTLPTANSSALAPDGGASGANPDLLYTVSDGNGGYVNIPTSDWNYAPAAETARNAFRGPGAWNVDASLSKTFPIRESLNLELRAEGFDVFNHHNLYVLGANNDYAASGGDITAQKGGIAGTTDERRFGQFAAKINF